MCSAVQRRIAVIGAGIGGLTLAIALRRYGINVDIYEQTSELREVGAAVALSANATRFFEPFGLSTQLSSHWFEVSALIFRDGRSGSVIGKHDAGATYRHRFGAPYVGIHRADLQAILSAAVGLDSIQLRKRLVDIDDVGARATLRFDDGSTSDADLVIGADGARSFVRRWVLGYDDALYSGCSGFRGMVPMAAVPRLPDPTALQFWMGPGGHLLHYPMGHDHINFLLVERYPAPWPQRDWIVPATEGEQLRHFAQWHPAVVEMITAKRTFCTCPTVTTPIGATRASHRSTVHCIISRGSTSSTPASRNRVSDRAVRGFERADRHRPVVECSRSHG